MNRKFQFLPWGGIATVVSIPILVAACIWFYPSIQKTRQEPAPEVTRPIADSVVSIRTPTGEGTGFVVDSSGLIVTAAHVVGDIPMILVVFPDSRQFLVEEMYINHETDVAVLSIDPNGNLPPPLEFGNSEDLEIGDEVVAIGCPFGHCGWHSHGVVAANRDDHILLMDIDINPGHSGGPVLYENKVVGMSKSHWRTTNMSKATSESVIRPAIELFRAIHGTKTPR